MISQQQSASLNESLKANTVEVAEVINREPINDLRKAIGKKNREAMSALKPEFYAGCQASNTSPDVVDWLWQTNEKSADYSFNKSHAACYALISYRTAWLRANYPAEYMAALISSVMDTKDKVPFFAARCEEMGIEILPPDVNLSDHEFVVVEGNIRFGLDAVKGVGYAAVEAIKHAREEDGPFESLWDFCARVDGRAVNRRAIEALIKAGAFDTLQLNRAALVAKDLSFGAFMRGRNLTLRADWLAPLAHWITPPVSERRYSTHFFLAALPDGQEADGSTS